MQNNLPTPEWPAYVAWSATTAGIDADWNDMVNRVIVKAGELSIHMSPGQAAELAADLIDAVKESGAGEVPAVLLYAFENVAEVTTR